MPKPWSLPLRVSSSHVEQPLLNCEAPLPWRTVLHMPWPRDLDGLSHGLIELSGTGFGYR